MNTTRALISGWASVLATCGLCLCAATAGAKEKEKGKPPATQAAPAAAGPATAGASDCPAKDPAVKKGPPININKASAKVLICELEGITAAMADDIVRNRTYDKVEDLLNRDILKSGVFQKIQSRLVVADPGGAGKSK